jgi:hypothetical protein
MKRSVKRSVNRSQAIENTPRTCLLAVLVLLAMAPVAQAGIADSPLPELVAGKKTYHLYSVPGVMSGNPVKLETFFSCTSTSTSTQTVGIEVFRGGGRWPHETTPPRQRRASPLV